MNRRTNPPFPPPFSLLSSLAENGEFAQLQQAFYAQHTQLWRAVLEQSQEDQNKEDQNNQSAPSQPKPLPAIAVSEPDDRRFLATEWSTSPYFDSLRQAYLINASFMKKMVETLPIADGTAKNRLRFLTRQYVDAMSPANFAATNPEFIKTAIDTKGASITAGLNNMLADLEKGRISMTDESAFEIGINLATTPGAVVYENELIQLIQYAPLTDKVKERPLVIIPPCINKFYILDLQPENSFVRYAVEQGYTVFLVSWRNIQSDLGYLTWDDYIEQGVLKALNVARDISKVSQLNALGFCIGGTLLTSALAVAKMRDNEEPVLSLTLLTTLLDFSNTGELGYFIEEGWIAAREAIIGQEGILSGKELANIFSSLRANDLIWPYVVNNYLKGDKPNTFDLLYWNSDSTNLSGPLICWYLRNLYLNNNLRVPGKLEICNTRADLSKITAPTFILATREDHIVPWQTAYLSRQLLGGETSFALGASGHIAGVINPISKNRRSYWTNSTDVLNAHDWITGATEQKGSWWSYWSDWLTPFSGKQCKAKSAQGNAQYKPIEPAPGRYVKERI